MTPNTPEHLLDLAIWTAVDAHTGQFDKGGNPYILHPLWVMNEVLKATRDKVLGVVAVLHDVAEDSDVTLVEMEEMFGSRVGTALAALYHAEGESYESYINRVAQNSDAVVVKLRDLRHNSDLTRLKGIRDKDKARMVKYVMAYHYLERVERGEYVTPLSEGAFG